MVFVSAKNKPAKARLRRLWKYIECMEDKLINDTSHWQGLKPPLSPNKDEVAVYERLCRDYGPVCLLGMTKELVHLCDYMVDLNPIPQPRPVIKSDWASFQGLAGSIMGDGVLNLVGVELASKLLRRCEILVCRVFLKKLDGMKYATHFPNEFPGCHEVIHTQPNVAIVVWRNSRD